MRKRHVGRSLLLLVFLSVLTPAAYPQVGDQRPRRQSSHIYQVSMRDEKSGEKRIGFIDKTGKLVIGFDRLPKTTIAVGDFREGRAVVYLKKEKDDESTGNMDYTVGYIDETGKVIIAPRFEIARDFSEGMAYVEAKDFKGFINRFGKVVIRVAYRFTKDFHEGLAAVGMSETEAHDDWGYIDRSGRLVIKQQYSFADDFSEGKAGVEVDRKYGFINQRGEMVILPRFELRKEYPHTNRTLSSGRFAEGLACVRLGNFYGYINHQGEFVIPPQLSRAQEFSEGLAWVVTKDEQTQARKKAGWIDKTGQWVVVRVNGRMFSAELPEFSTYANAYMDWRYSEGLVPFFVYEGDRALWGYMDRKGKVVIKPILVYYEAYGVTDREGTRVVIEPRGHTVGPFLGGVARVDFDPQGLEKAYGYIDKRGQFIWRSW